MCGGRRTAGFFPAFSMTSRGLKLLSSLLLLALCAVSGQTAIVPTEWPQRQALTVAAPGLVKITLPAATFDGAQPDLSDLRVVDPSGREVPYLLDRDLTARAVEPSRAGAPQSFQATIKGDTTQLLCATGTAALLESIELETSVPFFLKAALVEISADGTEWQSLGTAVPVFRQFGAEQLRLALHRRSAAFVRVTLDDFRSRQVGFTGVKLRRAPAQAAPPTLAPLGARLIRREEFAGETVLTVTLAGRHVALASLLLAVNDPLFMRRVTVSIREMQGAVSGERPMGSGTIYRVALDGAPVRTQLEVPLDFTPLTRELLVHIHNGDSPPLSIAGVQASQHPIMLLFNATTPGPHFLLSGNPQAPAPRYDLAAFAGEMLRAEAIPVIPGEREAMPQHQPRDSLATAPLPDVPLTGAPLDPKDWLYRRVLRVEAAGVQELELDPEVLARSQADFADLRLLHDGNQIPYLSEQPKLTRSLALIPAAAPDPPRPSVSIWQVRLPQAGLPFRRLVLTSATPLFQREFRIYEKSIGADGRAEVRMLATGTWSRTPAPDVPETRTFDLGGRVRTDTVWIETDNGDNPPLALGAVQVIYPVVRLIFKVAATDGLALAYGNKSANAPRYDLSLVAGKLLTSSRQVARFADSGQAAVPGDFFTERRLRYFFWGALALVVVVLLTVVAKLLPKPPAA